MTTPSSAMTELVESYGDSVIAQRWGATLVDFVVLYVLLVTICQLATPLSDNIKLVLCSLVVCSYYLFLEGLTGVTIGKLLSVIRVVGDDGSTPKFKQGAIRTIIRVVEVNPIILGGLPAGIVAAMSKKKQRLGDMIAGTYVVYSKDVARSA